MRRRIVNSAWLWAVAGMALLHSPARSQETNPQLDNKIVFLIRRGALYDLWQVGAEDGTPAKLLTLPESTERYNVSLDGKTLVYARSNRDNNKFQVHIWVANIDGTEPVKLTQGDFWNDRPSIDALGKHLVFFANEKKPAQFINRDGTGRTGISTPSEQSMLSAISPDGSQFVSLLVSGLYIAPIDGNGTPLQLTRNHSNGNKVFDSSPNFSPDGKQIVFSSNRDGDMEIYRINCDGSGLTRLTNLKGACGSPRYSPDGSHIVFVSNRLGSWQICTMKADGTDIKQITEGDSDCVSPVWIGMPRAPRAGAINDGETVRQLSDDDVPPTIEKIATPMPDGPQEITGTARDNASGIAAIDVALARYENASEAIPSANWDWKKKAWTDKTDPDNQGHAAGATKWRFPLPSLEPGFYAARVSVRDGSNNTTRADWVKFAVREKTTAPPTPTVSGGPAPITPPSTGNSGVTFLDGKAQSADATLSLHFSGPLQTYSATRAKNYTVLIGDKTLPVMGIVQEARENRIILRVPAGSLPAGGTVTIEWKDLRDEKNQSLTQKVEMLIK